MDERIPPQDIEAEAAVLGCMLLDRDAAGVASGLLVAQDFYRAGHRLIFSAISDLYCLGDEPDITLVRARLLDQGQLEQAGGTEYLNGLLSAVPSAANLERYAARVRRMATARGILTACYVATRALDEGGEPDVVRANLETALQANGGSGDGWTDIAEVGPEARQIHADERGFDVGLVDLQAATHGLFEGLNAISGMPGAGKTTLALQLVNRAILSGHTVCIVSADQARSDLFLAQWCNLAKMDEAQVRTDAGAEAFKRLISSHTVYYDGRFDLPSILAGLRVKASQGYRWVLIDYLGLIQVPGCRSEHDAAGQAAKALKLLARELHLTVILVISFTKPADSDMPRMEDARGTMEVIHAVEQLLILNGAEGEACQTWCRVVKSRHAGRGKVALDLRGAQHRFTDWGGAPNA